MSGQEQLNVPGNETTMPKHDENGAVVSVCCEAELAIHPQCKYLMNNGRNLEPRLISWVCSHCGALIEGVRTEVREVVD